VNNRDKVYTIPETIKVTIVTAQSQMTGQNQGSIRFFGDGSSTGGRVSLKRGESTWQIDINWLTGQIELENK
jgi:general secretion pathway protein H